MAEYGRKPLRPGLLAIKRDGIRKILVEQRRGPVRRDQRVQAIRMNGVQEPTEAVDFLQNLAAGLGWRLQAPLKKSINADEAGEDQYDPDRGDRCQ
jgi:hypothetical protein